MMDDRDTIGGKSPDASRDDRLAELFERYVDRLSAGERLDRDEIRRRHPEVADELLADLETLAGLGAARAGDGAGETFGDYKVLRRIGSGGMGIVYEAWDESMERQVALKVLPENLLANARVVARFVKEARIAGQLTHPNIVHVYGMGVDRGGPFYAMEFVDGKTLGQALSALRTAISGHDASKENWPRSAHSLGRLLDGSSESAAGAVIAARGDKAPTRPVTPSDDSGGLDLAYCLQAARAFADVADALSYAHRRGVTHRDLKPSNLMIDLSGRLRILDFGLARQEGEESLTQSGDLIGTLLYMSPEQAAPKRAPVDHRTDVYSLGATLYETLTFRPPFSGSDHRDLFGKILFADPMPLRRLQPRIPRDLETIVLKCLEKEPRDRYGTAEALAQDLRRFARGDPTEARPPSRLETIARRAWRKKGAIAAFAAFLLLGVATALLFRNHLETEAALRRDRYEQLVLDGMAILEYGQSRPPARIEAIESHGADPTIWGNVALASEVSAEGALAPHPAEEALRVLREASETLPDAPEAIFHAARALERLGRTDEALALLAPLTDADEPFAPAVVWCSLKDDTKPRAARRTWERSYVEAQLATRERRWDKAEIAYSDVLEAYDEEGEPYLGATFEARLARGVARLELDRYLEAIEDFAAARELVPGSPEPVLLVGKVYLERRMPDVAERRLEAIAGASPFGKEATQRVSALLLGFREYQRAFAWARRIVDPTTKLLAETRALVGLGRLPEALTSANAALSRAPADPRAHRALGHVLARSGRLDDAVASYREAVRLDGSGIDARLELGLVLGLARRHSEARAVYESVLERDARNVEALTKLGWNFAEGGQPEEALSWLERALALDPRSLAARNAYAYALGAAGRVDEAIERFRELLASDPDWSKLYTNLAVQLNRKKLHAEAVEVAREALEVDPANDEAYKILGARALHEGDAKTSIELLRQCVAHDPSDYSGWFYLGYAHETKGDADEAIKAYRRAIELNERDVRASYNLGNVYMRLELFEDAIGAFQGALKNDPDHADARNNIAIIYFQLEKYDAAARHLAEALRLDRGSPEPYWNLAAVREKQDRLAEAVDLLRQGLGKAPAGDTRPYDDLAAWLERSGDVRAAIDARVEELTIYAKQDKNAPRDAVAAAATHLEKLFDAAGPEARQETAPRAVELLRSFEVPALERHAAAIEALR